MKILHIDEQRGWRGGEQQASWLLQAMVGAGHEVSIAGRRGGAFVTAEHGGVSLHRLPLAFRNEFDVLTARRIARWARDHAVDIFHAHTSHAHLIACLARTLTGRGKVVVSRRIDFSPKRDPINRWKYGLPDMFISVSQQVDKVLREYGIPGARRRVVYSSVHPDRFDVEPLARSSLGIQEGVPLLVSAGALVGHKDYVTLLEAFARVRGALADARLLIAGEGEERARIERRIRELALDDAVTLFGHRSDAPRLTRSADVYVSSSWSEGLGTSVLEALACGTPVVATVAGGVGEMVIDGRTGRLVPNRNPEALAAAILETLRDRESSERLAAAGKQMVRENFTVERMTEGTLAVYGDLLRR